jgi:hypothetical protein
MHRRLLALLAVIGTASLLAPSVALGFDDTLTPPALRVTVSAVGLAVAVLLLIEVLALRKITLGGAMAEKAHLVVLAIICLATSELAKWTSNFVSGVTFEQTMLVSEMLVALAMALLSGYFLNLRTVMETFIASSQLPQEPPAASEGAE